MRNFSSFRNYQDFREAARRSLPSPMFHYIDGGSDDEWSLANNCNAFDYYELIPSYLRDVSKVDTTTNILGSIATAPLILSPTGMNRFFHHEKEIGVARAAEKHGLVYTLSTLGTTSIEDVAAVKSGPKMFQIYIHRDKSLTHEFVQRAKSAGYNALCLTVDMPIAGNRERDLRTGLVMPPRFTASSMFSFITRPGWIMNYLKNPDFSLANITPRKGASGRHNMSVMEYVNSQFDNTITWSDAAKIVEAWGGPFVIKGILSPEDAVRAKEIGASAVMISNHGGRQLDGAVAPVDCVVPIRDAVGDSLELIVDGGVRRGSHIVKALALGADAVSFGRPYLYALASGGQRGVDRFLSILTSELQRSMALLGCCSLDEIGAHHLRMLSR